MAAWAGASTHVGKRRPKGLLLVIHAKDLEATQASIEAAGGTIVQQTFPFPGGRRFHFTDPSGNELAVRPE